MNLDANLVDKAALVRQRSRIKVALINNMNNNFFSATRYFRDLGFDAHLFVLKESINHFNPQCDSFDNVACLDWVHEFPLSCSTKEWLFGTHKEKLDFLHEYDVVIACGGTLAFLHRANIDIDIVIPYGSDVFELPFYSFRLDRLKKTLFDFFSGRVHHQKKAFQTARYVCSSNSLPLFDSALKRLGVKAQNLGLPMLYNRLDYERANSVWEFLNEYDFVVFHHARHLWKTDVGGVPDFKKFGGIKRNDKIIRAYAEFLQTTNYQNPLLVLFEYGKDVDASKDLIAELGIQSRVIFMPLMDRKSIIAGLKRANIGSGSFREGLCCIAGTTYEVMSSGIPCITHVGEELTNAESFYYQAPIINALTEKQICDVFHDYESNPEKYLRLGEFSSKWFEENLGMGLAKKYCELILELCSRSK